MEKRKEKQKRLMKERKGEDEKREKCDDGKGREWKTKE